MRLFPRSRCLSAAALALIGVALLGPVEHAAAAAHTARAENLELRAKHGLVEGVLHLDPVKAAVDHDCIVCRLGSKSFSQTAVDPVRVARAAAALPIGQSWSPISRWRRSSPSRAPPVS